LAGLLVVEARATVAVVDDDPGILQSLAYLLESADYAVLVYSSAAALLDSNGLAKIDCLISDIDMPGIDGFELLQTISTMRPDLPTILITGYPDRLEGIPELGASQPRVFTKPFKGFELLAAVGESVGSRS
jgi:FixJ family two-component response regulator